MLYLLYVISYGKKIKNKIHVTRKLFIAVAIQLLGINYICDEPFIDKKELLASYLKQAFLHAMELLT